MATEHERPQAGEPFDPKRHAFEAIGLVCALPPQRWGLNDLSKLVYSRLALLSLQSGKAYPSEAYLARCLAHSERRIREAIGRLRRAGLLETRRRGPHAMEYTLLWPPAHQPDERPAKSVRSMAPKSGRIRPVISTRADGNVRSSGQKTGRIRPKDRTKSSKRPDEIVRQNEQQRRNKGNEQHQQGPQSSQPPVVVDVGERALRLLTGLFPDLPRTVVQDVLTDLPVEQALALGLWVSEQERAGRLTNPSGLFLSRARARGQAPDAYAERARALLKHEPPAEARTTVANPGDSEGEALWANLRSALAQTHPELRDHLVAVRVVGVDNGELILAAPPGLRQALLKAGIDRTAAQAGVAGVVLFATEETETLVELRV
jgi:biotin operon repressor